MAVQIRWLNEEKQIVVQTYQGDWTIKDFIATVNRTYRMIKQVSHPVDVISDFTKSARGPVHLMTLGSHLEKYVSPNQRLMIFVGANSYMRTMGAIAKRVSPTMPYIHYVQTLDEAHEWVEAQMVRA